MTTFHEQIKLAREEQGYSRKIKIKPNSSWSLQDYIDLMFCVDKLYLIQSVQTNFIINNYGPSEDIYSKHFGVEEKVYNGVKLPKYHNGREVISYPNAGR